MPTNLEQQADHLWSEFSLDFDSQQYAEFWQTYEHFLQQIKKERAPAVYQTEVKDVEPEKIDSEPAITSAYHRLPKTTFKFYGKNQLELSGMAGLLKISVVFSCIVSFLLGVFGGRLSNATLFVIGAFVFIFSFVGLALFFSQVRKVKYLLAFRPNSFLLNNETEVLYSDVMDYEAQSNQLKLYKSSLCIAELSLYKKSKQDIALLQNFFAIVIKENRKQNQTRNK